MRIWQVLIHECGYAHDDSRVMGRRVPLDVGEVKIESDKRAAFVRTNVNEARIALCAEGLLEDRVRLVVRDGKGAGKRRRKILVELERQAAVGMTRSRASSADAGSPVHSQQYAWGCSRVKGYAVGQRGDEGY